MSPLCSADRHARPRDVNSVRSIVAVSHFFTIRWARGSIDGAIDSDGKRNGSKRKARAPNASAANAATNYTKPYQRLYQGRLTAL